MTDGYTKAREAVEQLAAAPRPAGTVSRTLAIGPHLRQEEARLGMTAVGEFQLLVKLPQGRRRFPVPTGRTLRADWAASRNMGGEMPVLLVLTCSDARLVPTFTSLLGEMLDRAEASGRPCIDELQDALASWRAILARESDRLDRNKLIGLFGELEMVRLLAECDPHRALSLWAGPDSARHDFFQTNALEVKTYEGAGSPLVTIHGPSQLDPPVGGLLHLAALQVEESDEGSTISEAVDAVARLGVPRRKLLEKTGGLGEADDGRRLRVAEIRLFNVGDQFPGIRWSAMSDTQRMGIRDLNYTLALDACPGEIPSERLSTVLAEL